MRFNTFIVLLLSAAFLLINFGCNFSKPSGTVNEFSARIKNKNIENLDELFSAKFKQENENFFKALLINIQDEKKIAEFPELTSFEIEKEEIIDERASVITKSISTSGKVKNSVYVLTKENGTWKIESIDLNPGSVSSVIYNNFIKKQ